MKRMHNITNQKTQTKATKDKRFTTQKMMLHIQSRVSRVTLVMRGRLELKDDTILAILN